MKAKPNPVKSAVVFAYHDIGVRCLEALLELGVEVKLVITHQDQADEEIWFASVVTTCQRNGIEVITPENPNTLEVNEKVAQCKPDFLFSFYYRQMLNEQLLAIATQGSFNLHGSLLPRYRGRVPVNWAIIHGERESGVSLHRMESKPDAGNLLAQRAVPILRNDTAADVFQKIKCAAESMILEVVPEMIRGGVTERPQDLAGGSYFPGRKPQDGLIDWSLPAQEIHNLIRAVAPPYPGAFFEFGNYRIQILGSYYREQTALTGTPRIYWDKGFFWADCADGYRLMITEWKVDESIVDLPLFSKLFGKHLLLVAKRAETSRT